MIRVTRRAHLEHATPEEIFAALADPQRLVSILPRMQKVELLSRDEARRRARLVTHMGLGGIFGTVRCEGELAWEEPRELLFQVRSPVSVETRWTLTPALDGTEIQATMALDLAPLLGPIAAFVPAQQVGEMLGAELDNALKAIARQLRDEGALQRAAAA